jgi:hypothetical protein
MFIIFAQRVRRSGPRILNLAWGQILNHAQVST